ncbi:hypothetical protein [Phenylobacterium sp.]|uniref:hypothetical protein n=1 Tax=Phenylobacterium sp. TaxID=1871053 RepID=UPI002DF2302F|nr:hypothetical protein [Phenylobacterium sp.]
MNKTHKLLTLNAITLLPETSMPRHLQPKTVWYLAMVYLGAQNAAGRKLDDKLKAEAFAYLKEVNQHSFEGYVFEHVLEAQLDRAWEICQVGKNNLFKSLAANDNGTIELRITVGG